MDDADMQCKAVLYHNTFDTLLTLLNWYKQICTIKLNFEDIFNIYETLQCVLNMLLKYEYTY